MARLACSMAAQGLGTSRNRASALTSTPLTPKPSAQTSRQAEVICLNFKSEKKSLVISALCWLNSKVQRCPSSPMVSAIAQERDPDPVPASMTTDPGTSYSLKRMAELSIAYKIWVFRARVSVMSVDLGLMARMCLPFLLKAQVLMDQGWCRKLICRNAAPSEVWILLPATSWTSFGFYWVSNRMAQELSVTLSYSTFGAGCSINDNKQ